MSMDNKNYAYDLSLFEESPAYEPQRKNNVWLSRQDADIPEWARPGLEHAPGQWLC